MLAPAISVTTEPGARRAAARAAEHQCIRQAAVALVLRARPVCSPALSVPSPLPCASHGAANQANARQANCNGWYNTCQITNFGKTFTGLCKSEWRWGLLGAARGRSACYAPSLCSRASRPCCAAFAALIVGVGHLL